MASKKTLVRGARQLLTLRGPAGPRRGAGMGALGIIHDGAVFIRDGKIVEAGPSRRLENISLARGADEINAAGRVVLPGFVDCRTLHLAANGKPSRGLVNRVRPVLDGIARHGTTTVAASVDAAQERSSVMAMLRVLGGLQGCPLDVITDCYVGEGQDLEAICNELLPLLARRKAAQTVSVDWEGLDEAMAQRVVEQTRRLGLGHTVCAKASGAGMRLAMETRAASVVTRRVDAALMPDLSLAHSVCILIPPAPSGDRTESRATRALLEAGAPVALASGFGFDHSPTYNMQMVIALACAEMGLSAGEAISAATINGAHALGRGHCCGSLEPGKAADLLLLNIADYRELPANFGVNHVHMALKNGRVIYREGEVAC